MTNTPTPSRRASWSVRVALWLVIAAVFLLFLRFDVDLSRWAANHCPQAPSPGGWTDQFLLGFRDFGQILPVIVTCVIVAAFDSRRRRVIAAILLAQVLAMAAYNVGKLTIVRYRPNAGVVDVRNLAARWVDSWVGFSKDNSADRTQSFPSGHSAAAFALGTVLAAFYPRLAWLFWTLAVGCAASRFLQLYHWPSDCLAGAVIGHLCARLPLRLCLSSGRSDRPPDKEVTTLGERLMKHAGVAKDLPVDMTEQDDHYLHGHPKD
jgi:membrane-associated phospholipid phosphatase